MVDLEKAGSGTTRTSTWPLVGDNRGQVDGWGPRVASMGIHQHEAREDTPAGCMCVATSRLTLDPWTRHQEDTCPQAASSIKGGGGSTLLLGTGSGPHLARGKLDGAALRAQCCCADRGPPSYDRRSTRGAHPPSGACRLPPHATMHHCQPRTSLVPAPAPLPLPQLPGHDVLCCDLPPPSPLCVRAAPPGTLLTSRG